MVKYCAWTSSGSIVQIICRHNIFFFCGSIILNQFEEGFIRQYKFDKIKTNTKVLFNMPHVFIKIFEIIFLALNVRIKSNVCWQCQ